MKNLAEVIKYLGTQINKTQEDYTLNQKSKIKELVKKFNLENAKPYGTPMIPLFSRLEVYKNLLSTTQNLDR